MNAKPLYRLPDGNFIDPTTIRTISMFTSVVRGKYVPSVAVEYVMGDHLGRSGRLQVPCTDCAHAIQVREEIYQAVVAAAAITAPAIF